MIRTEVENPMVRPQFSRSYSTPAVISLNLCECGRHQAFVKLYGQRMCKSCLIESLEAENGIVEVEVI